MLELPKDSLFAGHRIEGLAGRGGMGVVYRAIQLELGRPVALKLIAPQLADDPSFRERFKREWQIAASIDHPNVIPIYQAGEAEGRLYITMRYVEGTDLDELIGQHGRLDPANAVRIIGQVAAALDAAHNRGLVHRDIKPANILVTRNGHDHVYLTDFGLTKDTLNQGGLTGTGQFVGTVDYAAPEQIEGKHPDARADIYALGCVLFHSVTGKRPYERDSEVAKLFAHLHEEPPSLADLLPAAPLDGVIRRALAKRPADRFPSAGDFHRAAVAALGAAPAPRTEQSVATGAAAGAEPPPTRLRYDEITRARQVVPETPPPATQPPQGVPPTSPPHGAPAATQPPHGAPPPTQPPGGPPPTQAPGPAAPPPGGSAARRRLLVVAACVAGIAAIAIAGVLLLGGGDDSDTSEQAAEPAKPSPEISPSDWRELRTTPTARQQVPAAVAGGTIWLIGGLTGDTATATVEGYDPVINSWKTAPKLPDPLHHAMAVMYKDELVVLGGWIPDGAELTAETTDKVYALRGDRWAELAPLNRPRAAGAAAVVGDKIVVMGGQADGELVAETEVFDGERWEDVSTIPTPRDHLAAASDGRHVYAVGGRELSPDRNFDSLERYDIEGDFWEELPAMPTSRGGLGATVVENRVVAVGGELPTSVLPTVEAFDIAAEEWSELPDLRTARHGLGIAAIGSTVYALGGATEAGHTSTSRAAESLRLKAE